MKSNKRNANLQKVFYVEGSGLFPVPSERLNEVPCLKEDYHRREVEKAWSMAVVRRIF